MSILEEGNTPEVTESSTTQEPSVEPVKEETTSFLDNLPEDLKGNPSLKDFKDVAGLANSYINAQKMIGNSLRIPSEEASKEQLEEFYEKLSKVKGVAKLPDLEDPKGMEDLYNKLGRPKEFNEYKFDIDSKAEELGVYDQVVEFKKLAHGLGLTPGQANALAKTQLEGQLESVQQLEEKKELTVKILKEEFGPDYNNRIEGAKTALKILQDKYPDAVQDIINTSGNNPIVVKLLSEYGQKLKEKGAIDPSSVRYGVSSEEARNQIQEIRNNKEHPYNNPTSREHSSAVSKMEKLYNIAYSGDQGSDAS